MSGRIGPEPACWSWPVPDVLADLEHPEDRAWRAEYEARSGRPLPFRDIEALDVWQADRCAMCGTGREHLVEDHDHATGLTRGLLCQGCNIREGLDFEHPTFALYRTRYPTMILGITIVYVGRNAAIVPEPQGISTVSHDIARYVAEGR